MDTGVCYKGYDGDEACDTSCQDCPHYGHERRRCDRRNRSFTFKFWERRDGFDRRRSSIKQTGLYHTVFRRGASFLRDNYHALVILLVLFNLFNIADYMFTLKALAAGYTEGNPIMDKLFGMGPAAAGIFKVTVGLFITSIVWLLRRYRLVLEASILILIMYMLLISYHIYGAIRFY